MSWELKNENAETRIDFKPFENDLDKSTSSYYSCLSPGFYTITLFNVNEFEILVNDDSL